MFSLLVGLVSWRRADRASSSPPDGPSAARRPPDARWQRATWRMSANRRALSWPGTAAKGSGCSKRRRDWYPSRHFLDLCKVGCRKLQVFKPVHCTKRYPLDSLRARVRRAAIEKRDDTAHVEPLLAQGTHGMLRGRAG